MVLAVVALTTFGIVVNGTVCALATVLLFLPPLLMKIEEREAERSVREAIAG